MATLVEATGEAQLAKVRELVEEYARGVGEPCCFEEVDAWKSFLIGDGAGCVLLVSDASGAVCKHLEDALVHRVGDTKALAEHLTMLDRDPALLARLRGATLSLAGQLTWSAAGAALHQTYRELAGIHRRATAS